MELFILFLKKIIAIKKCFNLSTYKLQADQIKENAKDELRLERIMLSKEEWEFMENLVNILKKFEEITRSLSGSKYVTLSLIYPLIFKLKIFIEKELFIQKEKEKGKNKDISQTSLLKDDEDELQNEILEEFEEIPDDEIANTIVINEKGSKKSLNILNPIETKGLVVIFLEALNQSLKK